MLTKISSFSEIILGYAFRGAIEADELGNTFLIQAKNIIPGQNIHGTQDLTKISFDGTRTASFLEKNDILIVSRGTGVGSFRCTVSEIDQANIIASSSIVIVRIKKSHINPYYIALYLNSGEGQAQIMSAVTGSYIQAISRKKLEEIKIPIPPLEGQTLIAQLHQNIQAQERIYTRKKELKQNLLTATLKNLIHS